MPGRVTLGVPVYKGELFLEETLKSVKDQSFEDFEVIISLDGPNPACEEICSRFQADPRFSVHVQPVRLGWVENINWLMSKAGGEFFVFMQQDDLIAATYLDVLVNHLDSNPDAALAYCDLLPMGRLSEPFELQPPSVRGSSAFMRELTMLLEQYPAFAFRGVTRLEATRRGKISTNSVENFGVDTVWLATVALRGELHRIPQALYRKRYHSSNTESRWWAWNRQRRLEAWAAHSIDMVQVALRARGTVEEHRMLWLAATQRLTSAHVAGHFLPISDLTSDERMILLQHFLEGAQNSKEHDIPLLLDSTWDEIREWTAGAFWVPRTEPLAIVDFGPRRIGRGQKFNVQPNGRSAIWVQASRIAPPGTRIRLAGSVVDTVLDGPILTAFFPDDLAGAIGDVPLELVGPDGASRSSAVTLDLHE
jgi:glycosyl transferase family 2